MEPFITRAEVQTKIQELVSASQDKDVIRVGVRNWLTDQSCSEFEISQILNDLTSYQDYLNLLN